MGLFQKMRIPGILCMCIWMSIALAEEVYSPYHFPDPEGEDTAYTLVKGDTGYGLLDSEGKTVLEPEYDEIGGFELWPDGVYRAVLFRDGMYGWYPGHPECSCVWMGERFSRFIIADGCIIRSDTGEEVLEGSYGYIVPLSDEYLAIADIRSQEEVFLELDEVRILNTELETLFTLECNGVTDISDGKIRFTRWSGDDQRIGYCDLEGNVLFVSEDDRDYGQFHDGYARIIDEDGRVGLINDSFQIVMEPDHNWITDFRNGYAIVCDRTENGYHCAVVNTELKEGFTFNTGFNLEALWTNGSIIVNQYTDSRYYVHDYWKSGLAVGHYIGKSLQDNRILFQSTEDFYGYLNEKGKVVIPARYQNASDFSDGCALVQKPDGKWTWIDADGREFGGEWEKAGSFRNGYAYASDGIVSGMVDRTGQIVRPAMRVLDGIEPEEEITVSGPAEWDGTVLRCFSAAHGYRIYDAGNGFYGLTDEEGNILLEPEYDEIRPPVAGIDGNYWVFLRRGDKWGWYSEESRSDCVWAAIPEVFRDLLICRDYETGNVEVRYADETLYALCEDARIIADDMIALKTPDQRSYIYNDAFELLGSADFDQIGPANEGMIAFCRNGKWGFCDLRMRVCVPAQYDSVNPFHDGYALVSLQHGELEYRALIDRTGTVVLDNNTYPDVFDFQDGYCVLPVRDKSRLSEDGTIQNCFDYEILTPDMEISARFTGNFTGDNRMGRVVYYDPEREQDVLLDASNGDIILEAERIVIADSRTLEVCSQWFENSRGRSGYWGLMDPDGNPVLGFGYREVRPYSGGLACVRRVDLETWLYVDTEGKEILTGEWIYADSFTSDGYAHVTDMWKQDWYIDMEGNPVAPWIQEDPEEW